MDRRRFVRVLGLGGAGSAVPGGSASSATDRLSALEDFLAASRLSHQPNDAYSVGKSVISTRLKLKAMKELGVKGQWRDSVERWVRGDNGHYGHLHTVEDIDAENNRLVRESTQATNKHRRDLHRKMLSGEHDAEDYCNICKHHGEVRNYSLLTSVGMIKIAICLKHNPPDDFITPVGGFAKRKRPTKRIMDSIRKLFLGGTG